MKSVEMEGFCRNGGTPEKAHCKTKDISSCTKCLPQEQHKVSYLPGSTNLERGSQATLGILWKWGDASRREGGEHKLPALSDLLPLPNFSPSPTPQAPLKPLLHPQQPCFSCFPPIFTEISKNYMFGFPR